MRTLPPRSVPNPRMLPPPAIRAASPPDDPPVVRVVSCGFTVSPNIGFVVSILKMKVNAYNNNNLKQRMPTNKWRTNKNKVIYLEFNRRQHSEYSHKTFCHSQHLYYLLYHLSVSYSNTMLSYLQRLAYNAGVQWHRG